MSDADTSVRADRQGFNLPSQPDQVLDVYFGEVRVFSAAPANFQTRNGRVHLPWPPALRAHLKGRSRLVVKEHLTGRILVDEPIQIGNSRETIAVTDGQGRALAVDKFGRLERMFTDTDGSTAHDLASEVARLVSDVNDFGVGGFLAYGSLLGAVRSGKLIGHDTDTDIAYLSNHTHPADIARESFALERFLVGRGWILTRMRVGLFRAVFHDQSGDLRHIDIFTGVHDGTRFYLDRFVIAELPRSALLPLSKVTFEGVEIHAPADPGAVLEATYGPSYLVPDPSFAYVTPRSLRRKNVSWMGDYGLRVGKWQQYLRGQRGWGRPGASSFAQWVGEQVSEDAVIVDVGCGAGGDLMSLARDGHPVIGIDYARYPLKQMRSLAEKKGLHAEFRRVSLYDVRQCLAAGTQLAGDPRDLVLMSRDLIDVLDLEGRANFWLLSRTALLGGGRLYLQFRTQERKADAQEPGFRTLDADEIEAEARARGARVVSREDNRGTTVMVLTWS